MDVELFRGTYQTNVFGAVTVIREFLPLLRASGAGRIVNVSSTMGSLADQTRSILAVLRARRPRVPDVEGWHLTGLTVALAKELADTPIKVNAICPGSVQTDLATRQPRNRRPDTPEEEITRHRRDGHAGR